MEPLASAKSSTSLRGHIVGRSVGLLSELQEYVESLEVTTQQQRRQLGQLKEEKRRTEELLWKQQHSVGRQQNAVLQQFEASEAAELPPRLRALFEDNKVLREEARRYKARAAELERAKQHDDVKLGQLQDMVARLRAAAAEGGPNAAEELGRLRKEIEARDKLLESANDRQRVLTQKLESDARAHRLTAAAATKEKAQLETKLKEVGQQLEARDREARAAVIAAKEAKRRLEDVKQEAARAAAAAEARWKTAVAAEAEHRQRQERDHVHLMLCLIRDGSRHTRRTPPRIFGGGQQAGEAAAGRASGGAAAGGTAAGRGSDRGLLSELAPEDAAVRIQAGVRGHLVRQRLRAEAQRRQRAAIVIQAGARGMRARIKALEIRLAAAQEGVAAVGGSAVVACSRKAAAALGSGGGGGGVGEQQTGTGSLSTGDGGLPLELPALPSGDAAAAGAGGGSSTRQQPGASSRRSGGSGGGNRSGRSKPASSERGARPRAGAASAAAPQGTPTRAKAATGSRRAMASAPQTIRSIASGAKPGPPR